jgi:hypothetical protein
MANSEGLHDLLLGFLGGPAFAEGQSRGNGGGHIKRFFIGGEKMKVVQNHQPDIADIQPVIDNQIVETVHSIFKSVIELNPLDDLFEDLANRLIEDLAANSLLDYNLELSDDQKEQLRKAVKDKGTETVRNYQANLNTNEHTKLVYGLVRENTTAIADSLLSSNCVELFKSSCQEAKEEDTGEELDPGEDTEEAAEKKSTKKGRGKK